MAKEPVLDRDIALSLLRPPGHVIAAEDLQHSWSNNDFPPFEMPFLRIWDHYSGSQPDHEKRMMSRAPRQRLDTRTSRRISLTTHIDHKIWEPTPYISFTTSPATIEDMAYWRANRSRRGAQTLTVLDPNARIADGLPILDVRAEMNNYGIPDPYRRSDEYYIDHYVCVWEVTEQEIIGHWEWNDLVANKQWYHDIILPAFREHSRRTISRSPEEETLGLSSAMGGLSCMFFNPRNMINRIADRISIL